MNASIVRLLFCAILLLPATAPAAQMMAGDSPVLPETQVVEDDLYVAGGMVRISGEVRGDLVVAGGEVDVEGDVTGDVLAAGGSIRIGGKVGGTIRAAGGQITIMAPVGEDVVVTGGSVTIGSSARVGRDLIASGGQVEIAGPVARRVSIAAGDARVGADVGGNVEVQVRSLEVGAVTIGGELAYPSDAREQIDAAARVQGGIVQTEPLGEREGGWGFGATLFFLARLLVGMWALGALFAVAAPGWSARAAGVQLARPGMAVLAGLGVLLVVPLLAVLVFGIGLLVGGWWIGLILLALYLVALCLAVPLAALALGRAIATRVGRKQPWAWPLLLLAGLVVLVLFFAIPVFGMLVGLVAILFGLGGLVLGARARSTAPATLPG